MRKSLLASLCAFALLASTLSAAALAEDCSGSITAAEALASEDARYTAQTTRDFTGLEKLIGEDLVYIHSAANVDDKTAYIETQRAGTVIYRSMKRSDVKVRTYGCLAIITGQGNFDVTLKGQDLSVEIRFHSIWAKRGGRIEFVSWEATRIPPKQ